MVVLDSSYRLAIIVPTILAKISISGKIYFLNLQNEHFSAGQVEDSLLDPPDVCSSYTGDLPDVLHRV